MPPLDFEGVSVRLPSFWLDDRGGVLWVGPFKRRKLHIPPSPQGNPARKRNFFIWAAKRDKCLFIHAICWTTNDNSIHTTRVAYRQKKSHELRKIRDLGSWCSANHLWFIVQTFICSNFLHSYSTFQRMSFYLPLKMWPTLLMNSHLGLW